MSGKSSADATASPFVIAINNAGIVGLDSVMNVVIMIAVLSVGNSSVYGSSRTLAALAEQHQAPRIFAYIDRKGRPLVGIGIASVIGLLAFVAASQKSEDVFNWLLALSGLSSVFTWGSICLAHIRFRRAWMVQGRSLKDLAFRSQAGLTGSWIGFIFNLLVLVAQFWVGFAPIGYAEMTPLAQIENFFKVYLAVPIVILCYVVYKLWYRTPFMRAADMDLHSGIRELNIAELVAEERAERATWSVWRRGYKFLC